MPELPEVETTARILNGKIKGLKIFDVWTDYDSAFYKGKDEIRNKKYFPIFKKTVIGAKFLSVSRRAKNVLLNLSNGDTILVHMKMTGHLLWGKYKKSGKTWMPYGNQKLSDPYNRFIHLVFSLSDGSNLVLSDARKFAKIKILNAEDLAELGPEPLEKSFTREVFRERILKRPNSKIKTVLMDQTVLAGVGNIYSDESLWVSGINPQRIVSQLKDKEVFLLYKNLKSILKKSIQMGGDSMSDYRKPNGEKGKFQNLHKVYQRRGEKCLKKGCRGFIKRTVIGGRSSHFCNECQI